MRSILLIIEYDGTNYAGWQVQPNGTAIQAVIEDALIAERAVGNLTAAVDNCVMGQRALSGENAERLVQFSSRWNGLLNQFVHAVAQGLYFNFLYNLVCKCIHHHHPGNILINPAGTKIK